MPSTSGVDGLDGVDIQRWHRVLGGEGFVLHPLARRVLTNFGGLRVRQPVGVGVFRNADILFEPELAGSGMLDIAGNLKDMLGQDFYPIGEWITNSTFGGQQIIGPIR